MNGYKKVTILLAIYKPKVEWLIQLLQSLNNQTYRNIELIIWNDAPDDKRVHNLFDKFITNFKYKYFTGEKNIGSNRAFEQLTHLADGEYIAYCDQDDIWLADKISVLVKEIENSNAVLVCSDAIVIDQCGIEKSTSIHNFNRIQKFDDKEVFEFLLYQNLVTGCTVLTKTDFVKNVLPFPEDFFHDWWLGLCAANIGKIKFVRKALIKYRIHSSNQSGIMRKLCNKKDWNIIVINKLIRGSNILLNRMKTSVNYVYIEKYKTSVLCRKAYLDNPTINTFKCYLGNRGFIRRKHLIFELLLPFIPNIIFRINGVLKNRNTGAD